MPLPLRPFGNPSLDQVDLVRGQSRSALRRRHPELRVVRRDPLQQLALIRLSRDDDRGPIGRSKQPLALVEPQVRLPLVLIGAMTLIARLREDRADLPVEINAPVRITSPRRGWDRQENHAGDQARGRMSHSHLQLSIMRGP